MTLGLGLLQPGYKPGLETLLAGIARPIGIWKLDEPAGGTAIIEATDQRPDGVYGVDTMPGGGQWIEGGPIAAFPGNKSASVYSDNLRDDWDWEEYSVVLFAKVNDPALWTDGSQHNILSIYSVGTTQRCEIRKQTTNGQLAWILDTGAASKSFTKSSLSTTSWMLLGATVSKSAGASGEARVYFNGVQEGATQTSIGTDDGSLMDRAIIGAASVAGGTGFVGLAGYLALYKAILTPSDHARIYDRFLA